MSLYVNKLLLKHVNKFYKIFRVSFIRYSYIMLIIKKHERSKKNNMKTNSRARIQYSIASLMKRRLLFRQKMRTIHQSTLYIYTDETCASPPHIEARDDKE